MEQAEPQSVVAGQVTQLLNSWRGGDSLAQQQLMEIVYAQLRAIAVRSMRTQRPSHTLCPTELVHEAWLKLDGAHMDFEGRAHFLGLAATAMRCILVDYARAKSRGKRFGGMERVPLDEAALTVAVKRDAAPESLLDLDRALNQLTEKDSRKGQLMELVYFGGARSRGSSGSADALSPDRAARDSVLSALAEGRYAGVISCNKMRCLSLRTSATDIRKICRLPLHRSSG